MRAAAIDRGVWTRDVTFVGPLHGGARLVGITTLTHVDTSYGYRPVPGDPDLAFGARRLGLREDWDVVESNGRVLRRRRGRTMRA